MDKKKLLEFKDALDQLYKQYGFYLYTDGSAQDIFIVKEGDTRVGVNLELVFHETDKEYIVWQSENDPYKGRQYTKIEEDAE